MEVQRHSHEELIFLGSSAGVPLGKGGLHPALCETKKKKKKKGEKGFLKIRKSFRNVLKTERLED